MEKLPRALDGMLRYAGLAMPTSHASLSRYGDPAIPTFTPKQPAMYVYSTYIHSSSYV